MPRRIPSRLALALLGSMLAGPSHAQDAEPKPQPDVPQPKAWGPDDLKPKPPIAIPDDPPPHEGAMIDLPYIIEPPDILLVEVIEALPGRPITGDRLVRQDGTISLGFYGEVAVRGLTLEQAKVKIIRRLQQYVTDDVLGLSRGVVVEQQAAPNMPGPARNPLEPQPAEPGVVKPPATPPPAEGAPTDSPKSKPAISTRKERRPGRFGLATPPRRPAQRPRAVSQVPGPKEKDDERAKDEPKPEVVQEIMVDERDVIIEAVDPAESIRVFVDVSSYFSKTYFVQGDVGVPGRLPFTGKDTILDAMNYAGGLTPTAEPNEIHLYRPASGGKPARDYKIDWGAILKGDSVANLQMFPNDRLVVGRNVVVQKTVEIDRAAAPMNSVFNHLLQQSFTTRSMGAAAGDINGTTQAQRDAALRSWSEFLWGLSSKEGGAMLDDKAFREAVMKQLGPASPPK